MTDADTTPEVADEAAAQTYTAPAAGAACLDWTTFKVYNAEGCGDGTLVEDTDPATTWAAAWGAEVGTQQECVAIGGTVGAATAGFYSFACTETNAVFKQYTGADDCSGDTADPDVTFAYDDGANTVTCQPGWDGNFYSWEATGWAAAEETEGEGDDTEGEGDGTTGAKSLTAAVAAGALVAIATQF